MKNYIRSAAAALALTTLTAGVAPAATIVADYELGYGKNITIKSSSQGVFKNVYAGSFILDPTNADEFFSFCVDLAHYIKDGVTYQMKSVGDSGFSSVVQTNIKRLFSGNYGSLGQDKTENAAFQVALWEIIDEGAGPLSLTSGVFTINNTNVRTRAQQMLDNLGAVTDEWTLTFYEAGKNQDQISAQPTPPLSQVPVPAGLPLLLTAIGGLALTKRRRKNA